jgi:hypothetical protein
MLALAASYHQSEYSNQPSAAEGAGGASLIFGRPENGWAAAIQKPSREILLADQL